MVLPIAWIGEERRKVSTVHVIIWYFPWPSNTTSCPDDIHRRHCHCTQKEEYGRACLQTMKFSSAAIILLSAAHCAYGLVSGQLPHSVIGRSSLRSTSKLFSSAAADSNSVVSVGGDTVGLGINGGANVVASTNGSAALSSDETYNVKYGPGKLELSY